MEFEFELPLTALRALNWSKMAVVKVSIIVNILSRPKVKIMKKNKNDINGGTAVPI